MSTFSAGDTRQGSKFIGRSEAARGKGPPAPAHRHSGKASMNSTFLDSGPSLTAARALAWAPSTVATAHRAAPASHRSRRRSRRSPNGCRPEGPIGGPALVSCVGSGRSPETQRRTSNRHLALSSSMRLQVPTGQRPLKANTAQHVALRRAAPLTTATNGCHTPRS